MAANLPKADIGNIMYALQAKMHNDHKAPKIARNNHTTGIQEIPAT